MLLFQKLVLSKINLSILDNVQEVLILECLAVNDRISENLNSNNKADYIVLLMKRFSEDVLFKMEN